MGEMTPVSGERVLLFESSPNIKRIPHTTSVTKIAPKLNSERFKNRELIGAYVKKITIKIGANHGVINIRYIALVIFVMSTF